MITVPKVLAHFVAATNAPSTTGAQLEELSTRADTPTGGRKVKASPRVARNEETTVMRNAEIYRFASDLGNIKGVKIDTAPTLVKVSYATGQGVGRVVVRTLRAYQAALSAPSREDLERAKARADKAPLERQHEVAQKALAEYRAPRGLAAVARENGLSEESKDVAELYGDCLLVLGLFVQSWNRRLK